MRSASLLGRKPVSTHRTSVLLAWPRPVGGYYPGTQAFLVLNRPSQRESGRRDMGKSGEESAAELTCGQFYATRTKEEAKRKKKS